MRHVGAGDGPENFGYHKPNNLKISPDNTKHCYLDLPVKRSGECVNVLAKIGLDDPIIDNEFGIPSKLKSSHPFSIPQGIFHLLIQMMMSTCYL